MLVSLCSGVVGIAVVFGVDSVVDLLTVESAKKAAKKVTKKERLSLGVHM